MEEECGFFQIIVASESGVADLSISWRGIYIDTDKLLSHIRESEKACLYSLCPVLPSKAYLLIKSILRLCNKSPF